ncbi:thioredoxin family protein [Candidatus Kaiserbacteria bacterium]|nr:thioredoxin family protein [Candidatus Kaiserbacteria bacterium]
MSTQNIVIGIVTLLLVAGGAYMFISSQSNTDESMMKDDESAMIEEKTEDEMMQKDDAMMQKDEDGQMMSKGSYEVYSPEKLALASKDKVVLYFHANWCPICRPLDAAFKAGVPEGVHILKVDYDTSADLKKKYGVTYQHTFVQVDVAGNSIAKWGDAFTAADVFARVK